MKYVMEIYLPGTCYKGSVAALFESDTPFLAIHPWDLLNRRTWEDNPIVNSRDQPWTLLRVIRIEHLIWEGTQKALVFTEIADDTAETRTEH